MKTIAILGGGFSGTVAAVNLARLGRGSLRVCLVNRGYPMGRGVAYSTKRGEHLLNVVARNMSALSDRPNHFVEYLTTRSEYADVSEHELRETFAPRRVFGDYIRGLFQSYCRSADERPGLLVEHFDREAVDIDTDDGRPQVVLDDGTRILADKVLLATGNQSPCAVLPDGATFEHPAFYDNPWSAWEKNLPDRHENVLLIGTGLTMVDAFLTLSAYDWQGTIYAVSRNGLLPLSHFKGIEYPEFPPCDPSTLGLTTLNAMLEDHCNRLRGRGANPAIVVDKLRPYTQQIWRNFSLEEKQEFCRRYKARWNVTRHRIAPQIHAQLTAALESGKLQTAAGRIGAISADGPRISIRVDGRNNESQTFQAGMVLNCTGPRESVVSAPSPLFHKLIERGHVRSDDIDMGIDVAPDFTVLDRQGSRSRFLYAIGSLLKGTLWETTAVPELRGQTYRVALALLEQYAFDVPQTVQFPVQAEMELLEYCIELKKAQQLSSLGFILFGICVGLLSGVMGIGGGIVLVPGLMILFNFKQVEAQGTSLAVLSLPVLVFAAYVYYRNGHVRLPVVAEIAGGLFVGAYLGALLVPLIPVSAIRLIFGALLLYVGFTFVFNEKVKSAAALPAGLAAVVTTIVAKLLGRKRVARAMNLPAPSQDVDYHI